MPHDDKTILVTGNTPQIYLGRSIESTKDQFRKKMIHLQEELRQKAIVTDAMAAIYHNRNGIA